MQIYVELALKLRAVLQKQKAIQLYCCTEQTLHMRRSQSLLKMKKCQTEFKNNYEM